MNTAQTPPPTPQPPKPSLPIWQTNLEKVSLVLGSPPRWRILIALGNQEWLPSGYLATKARVSRTGVSQHLRVLREAKIVEQGHGRLYRIAPALRGSLAEGWLDLAFARVRLRFDQPPPVPATAALDLPAGPGQT